MTRDCDWGRLLAHGLKVKDVAEAKQTFVKVTVLSPDDGCTVQVLRRRIDKLESQSPSESEASEVKSSKNKAIGLVSSAWDLVAEAPVNAPSAWKKASGFVWAFLHSLVAPTPEQDVKVIVEDDDDAL